MIKIKNSLSWTFNFLQKLLFTDKINFDNNNFFNTKNYYDITSLIRDTKEMYTNGKYFIFNKEKFYFSPYQLNDDLNNINKNVNNKKIKDIIEDKALLSQISKEYYKYFIHVNDNKTFIQDNNLSQLLSNNLFWLNFTKARWNIFDFDVSGKKMKMFAYSVPIDKILLFENYLDLPNIKLLETNIYNPEVFTLESLLYFYEKSKSVFLDERIKLINYIKSIWINLDNFAINIKNDDYFTNKVRRITNNDIFYKYFLLLYKNIGVLGNINIDVYVFAEDKGKTINIVEPFLYNWKLDFRPYMKNGRIIDNTEMVYINYINRYNERLSQTTYTHSLWFNYKWLWENIHFYTFEQINKIFSYLWINDVK